MEEKICGKGEFWAWNEIECVMEGESGEQVGGELESVTSSAGCFMHVAWCPLSFVSVSVVYQLERQSPENHDESGVTVASIVEHCDSTLQLSASTVRVTSVCCRYSIHSKYYGTSIPVQLNIICVIE